MKDWRPFFALEKPPRPEQADALDRLCLSVESGKRRLVAELGTGVGKSAIAATMGAWLEAHEATPEGFVPGTTVLTSQIALQEQYIRDFKTGRSLKSAANFPCHGPIGGTCAETSRVRKAVGKEMLSALKCEGCPYRQAKDDFLTSRLGVTNYSYFLSEAMYAGELPTRHLLVCDEAHNIEKEVRHWATVEVSDTEAEEFNLEIPYEKSEKVALEWLEKSLKSRIEARLDKLGGKLSKLVAVGKFGDGVVSRLANENDRLDKWKCRINRLLGSGAKILVSSHDGRTQRTVKFQPLEVGDLANQLLYSRSSVSLLMSATIIDLQLFSSAIGLNDATFVGVPSPFKKEAFGVKWRPIGKMSQDGIEKSLRSLPKAIERILAEHPNDKGVIHSVNYRITQEIGKIRNPRLLVQQSAKDRGPMLELHSSSLLPTVLVSPGMMEGLDLKDELGRFQVICKVPYPHMGDPAVKGKSFRWQMWNAIRSLVQAAGRCVRSETDWARTYILDECFMTVLSSDMLPPHLRITDVEEPF